jgi:hypothetical protein
VSGRELPDEETTKSQQAGKADSRFAVGKAGKPWMTPSLQCIDFIENPERPTEWQKNPWAKPWDLNPCLVMLCGVCPQFGGVFWCVCLAGGGGPNKLKRLSPTHESHAVRSRTCKLDVTIICH